MMRLSLLVSALTFLAGCALTDLGKNLDQDSCSLKPLSFCAELNQISPVDDPMLAWSCNETSGVCEIQDLDADSDGVGYKEDCDDNDAARTPGAAEVCDGVDNDCDERIDEDSYALKQSDVANLTEDNDVIFDSFDVAQNPETLQSLFVYQKDSAGQQDPFVAFLDKPNESVLVTRKTTPVFDSQSVAIAFDDGSTFRTMFARGTTGSGARAASLGDIDTDNDPLTLLNSGGDYRKDTGFSSTLLSSDNSGEANGSAIIGTFQDRNPNLGDGCKNVVGSANGLEDIFIFSARAPFTNPTNGQQAGVPPVLLGRSQDPSKAAAVAIGANKWLVAYANGVTEGISIKLATIAPNSAVEFIDLNGAESFDIATDEFASQVAIARSDDGSQIAVAAKTGCGVSDLSISLLEFSTVFDEAMDETLYSLQGSSPFSLKQTSTKAFPSLMWREAPTQGWFLAYQEAAARAVVVMLDTEGNELGTGNMRIHDTGANTHKVGSRLIRAANDSFAIISPIHNVNTPSEIQISTLQCELSNQDI